MGGVIAQHQEPKEGAAPVQYSELNVSGFKEQLWVCLRRNFTIYNRAPGELAARDCDGGEAAGRGKGSGTPPRELERVPEPEHVVRLDMWQSGFVVEFLIKTKGEQIKIL